MRSAKHSLALGAGALAMLALAACQSSESPTESKHVEADPAVQTPVERPMPEGRKATDAEVASFLARAKDLPAVDLGEGKAPLAKAAALATCIVDFNNQNSLAALSNQASMGISYSPHYKHPCNGSYTVHTEPYNYTSYRLTPENPRWCGSNTGKIGWKDDNSWFCSAYSDGKLWPRRAGGVGGNTGFRFYVKTNGGTAKNFNLQAFYMASGTTEVLAYRPGIGWWIWYPHTSPGRWYWPANNTVSDVYIYSYGQNGYFLADNIEIGIIP